MTTEKVAKKVRHDCRVLKVDTSLGLVFGYAIVSKVDGEPYYDLHGHHIAEDVMMAAGADFMEKSRMAWDMHTEPEGGSIVFAFPITKETAEAFDLGEPSMTGLAIAMKPANEETLAKYADGTYGGFSIGGYAEVHEVDADE